jgi:PAS domain S-box-containing protein
MGDGQRPDNLQIIGWLFENHPDGVLVVDPDGRVVAQNRRVAEVCGFFASTERGANPSSGLTAAELVRRLPPPHDGDVAGAVDEIALDDGRILERQWARFRGPDGRWAGCVWFFRDVSARKEAETNLWRQIDELQRWQDIMVDREWRMVALKREVNDLCARVGEPIRYSSQGADGAAKDAASLTTTSESPRLRDGSDGESR